MPNTVLAACKISLNSYNDPMRKILIADEKLEFRDFLTSPKPQSK